MIKQLDYHIADNAEKPAILLTDAADGTTLGVFPQGVDDPLVLKIVCAYNAHDGLLKAAEEMREYIRNRPATFENGSILARANRAIEMAIGRDDDDDSLDNTVCAECGHQSNEGDETHYPECSRIEVQ